MAVGEAVAQALGERMAVGRVLGEQVELVVPAQVAREQQAGVVGHQRKRLALLHRRTRQRHALEHEGARLLGAKHAVEAVADAEVLRPERLHRTEHQLLAARCQPGHVADAPARGLGEDGRRIGLADELLEPLARAVPVDQEDDARADALQHLVQRLLVGAVERGGADVIGGAEVEPGAGARLRLAPARPDLAQQRLEEGEAAAVEVGVGERDTQALDLDHQHVGVVGADVVLQQQAGAVAGGGGVQPGVVELEGAGGIEPAHEGGDARAVERIDLPHVGAVDGLAGELGGEAVERLVQIHHQQVQAVVLAALATGERLELRRRQRVGRKLGQPGTPVRAARVEVLVALERSRHRAQVLGKQGDEAVEAGHVQLLALAVGGRRQLRQPGRIDPGGGELACQVERRSIAALRVVVRRLQHAEIELQSIVGGQRHTDPRRPEQFRLSQAGDGLELLHGILPLFVKDSVGEM